MIPIKNLFRQNRFIYLLIGLALLGLAALNFFNWIFLQSFKQEILKELKTQFTYLGNTTARLINGSDLEEIAPGMENTPAVLYYQQLLFDIKISNHLENIFLLDLTGKKLIDYQIGFRIGDAPSAFPLQKELFRKAALGEGTGLDLMKYQDQYFLTAYVPVTNDLGDPVAVLVMDAPMRFFRLLQKFQNGVLYLGLVSFLVLVLFSLLVVFATRRLFRIESQLREQERLAQLGQMAASVAHEIRNPLSIMKGTAEVLQKKYQYLQDEMFAFIPEEIDRLNRLVHNFLQFAREKKLNPRPLNVVEVLQNSLTAFNDSRIELRSESDLPLCRLDSDALKQIVLNLVQNALDELGQDGKVEVVVRRAGGKGKKILIEIRDNGPGIPPEDLPRIFTPFFSRKATGSGLGLPISKQLVEQMNGRIEVESEVGHGTTVRIWLPC